MRISTGSEPSGGGPLPVPSITAETSRIFRNGEIVANKFVAIADDAAAGSGAVIVSLKRLLAEQSSLLSRGAPLGVRLETSDSVEALKSVIPLLDLVEIHVPLFKDGRGFSLARQLRTRLGFGGEIRISGHFLIDQIAFYLRVGASSFVLRGNVTAAEIRQAIAMISNIYQPSTDGRPTIPDLRGRMHATPKRVYPLNS